MASLPPTYISKLQNSSTQKCWGILIKSVLIIDVAYRFLILKVRKIEF